MCFVKILFKKIKIFIISETTDDGDDFPENILDMSEK